MQQQQRQQQFDIYFKGSKNQLFAMLYPLTGPNSPIFDHLEVNTLKYYGKEKQLQFAYKTKDFSNIDRQQLPVVYSSTALPTHSNYFYSSYLPEKKAIVWQNITRMVQLRPTDPSYREKLEKKQLKPQSQIRNPNEMQVQNAHQQQQVKQLTIIPAHDENNKAIQQIQSVPDTEKSKLNKNWDISRDQYIVRLCQ